MTAAATISRRRLFGLSEPTRPRDQPVEGVAVVTDACIEAIGTSCRACEAACPVDAIRFQPRLGGGAVVTVLADRCNGCGECPDRCPVGAITIAARTGPQPYLGARS